MCGIAGIISKTQRAFDYSAFCSLGIINDRRGGDSCGIFIDGKVEYGVKQDKYFEDFFLRSKLLDETRRSTVALLHCRKASIGAINESTAQPVVLRDNKGKVLFVVIHNGTIYNYKELAEKYIPEVDIKGMTDSQVIARIFYYKGYDVLDEYNGGAVFVIVDYRHASPKTLLFKGQSKEYEYSKETKEERPLFYCINPRKRELVFSSIASQLMAVRRDDTAYYVPANELLEFDGKDLLIVEEYTRKNCQQRKEIPVVTPPVYKKDYRYDDIYDMSAFTNYISVDIDKNLYTFKGKRCHGLFHLGKFGLVYKTSKDNPEIFNVWFYSGVPMANFECYQFLNALRKESGLTEDEFDVKMENTIRFLSLDRVYSHGVFFYEAVSPITHIPFTGVYQPITIQTTYNFSCGAKTNTYYAQSNDNIVRKLSQNRKFDFNIVREKCKSLMK